MIKRLILVGGGYTHLSMLQGLAKNRPVKLDVVLITPHDYQNCSARLSDWVAGHHALNGCRVDLTRLAAAAGVRMLQGYVAGMDATRNCVVLTDGRQLNYDLLSMNVGSETDTSWLELLGKKLLPVKPVNLLFTNWPGILAMAKKTPNYKLVVVGGGATGVELALAAQHAFSVAGIVGRVDLVVSENGLLPGHHKQVQLRVERFAHQVGLRIHFARGVGTEEGVLLSDGQLLSADCVIAATGTRAPVWLTMSKLALNADGFVQVDAYHRSVSHPNVFAVGDVCVRKDVAQTRSVFQAIPAGAVLAENIVAMHAGRSLKSYKPRPPSLCFLACGSQYAVASWRQWSIEGQWVWHWKEWVERHLIQRFSAYPQPDTASLLEKTP